MRGNCVVTYNSDVKFKRDWQSLNPYLAASRFHKILNRGPVEQEPGDRKQSISNISENSAKILDL